MTSEQFMLAVTGLWLGGCALFQPPPAPPLDSPYAERQVWAVAPLRNESGTQSADGLAIADQLAWQLEGAANIDVLPVNRTLSGMRALRMTELTTPAQAMKLLGTLQADALVVGTVTAFDPYDPPKLGLALELYVSTPRTSLPPGSVRELASAATPRVEPLPRQALRQPVSVVSGIFDAADPSVRAEMQRYAVQRGATGRNGGWRLYRISMDLYTQFVGYAMSGRLLQAEQTRLAPSALAEHTP